ncbi:MAG: hypothetical protein Q9208_006031 [Pyrenodesmia sp. 3 TL-2023]
MDGSAGQGCSSDRSSRSPTHSTGSEHRDTNISGARYKDYWEYLTAIGEARPGARYLLHYHSSLLQNDQLLLGSQFVSVLNISADLALPVFNRNRVLDQSSHLKEFEACLRNVSPTARTTRVVLLGTQMASEVIAAVGAIFDIEPLFFATAVGEDESMREALRIGLISPNVSWATMPGFVDMCRGYCAKVIPKATIDGQRTDLTVGEERKAGALQWDVDISMYKDLPSHSKKAKIDISHVSQTLQNWSLEEIHAANATPMLYVLPLAYQSIEQLMLFCAEVDQKFTSWKLDDKAEKVAEGRKRQLLHTNLTEHIEWARTGFENLVLYASLDELKKMPGLPGRKAKAVATSFELAIERASRKEQQIKDYLQMQVGVWSLEESRRSLEDGKRLKTRRDLFLFCSTLRD